jgi:exopolysaccharide biosynthesis polyprenyl glycosylphosphotransferase
LAAILLAGVHAALAIWITAAHRRGLFAETIVLVGATETARRLAKRAEKSGEARIVAVVDDRSSRSPLQIGNAPVIGAVDDLLSWDGLPNVDRIVITVTQKAEARVRAIIERLRVAPNRIDLLLDYETSNVRGRGAERFGGATVACVSGRPQSHRRAFVKRAQDLVLATVIASIAALPMLVIALIIRLDSKGPALYRQRRHGFNNRIITVLKFRTMRHDPEAPLRQVSANDPRITRIGRFLRRTSLDELPQLINVIRGEMSLVGPRPHAIGMKASERELTQIVAEYAHRHRVKPGITGWAQVNGSRGPVASAACVRRRVRLDLDYVARASLWLDLEILARSVPIVLGDVKVIR